MASDLSVLPSTTYQAPPTSQARHRGAGLNTIIEEDPNNFRWNRTNRRGANQNPPMDPKADSQLDHWLSPMSDHFPTPRGMHFLPAPIVPSSPSVTSVEDNDDDLASSSSLGTRSSFMTDSTDFDDLYDVSDDEQRARRANRSPSAGKNKKRVSSQRQTLPQLVIPPSTSPVLESPSEKKVASHTSVTPATKLVMSPEALSFMHAKQSMELPTDSAPPSLDGSLTSEQLAIMSAPATPVIGHAGDDAGEEWSGVRLQPNALATLQALSGNDSDLDMGPDSVLDVSQEPIPEMRQQPPRLMTNFNTLRRGQSTLSPLSSRAFTDLTRLDIPSPGGFFSDLSPRTRRTWDLGTTSIDELAPPTSTTAEQFYRAPWNLEDAPAVPALPATEEEFYRAPLNSTSPVEHVVEVDYSMLDEDDMPTAKAIPQNQPQPPSSPFLEVVQKEEEIVVTEIVVDDNQAYARKQQEELLSHLDRTGLWLRAQQAYLQGVDVRPVEMPQSESASDKEPASVVASKDAGEKSNETAPTEPAVPKKKTVRFSEAVIKLDIPCSLPPKHSFHESAYYRAFQDCVIRTHRQDVFVHQLSRFEALQAQRVSMATKHKNQLLGKYQLSVLPQSAKKRLSANVARDDHELVDDPSRHKREKEREAMEQMTMAAWHIAARKMLNGGQLISAPIAARLARLSRMMPRPDGTTLDRARILDLGGQTTCDWAWHCALQFPNTKVYTVTTKAIRQASNCNIRGPPNHRQVAVDRLTRLPFDDNQFDLISARELHALLKYTGENGEDEWESCLRECMRVLKPGGYLEFSLLDSDVINAGPLGLAKSVEFGFLLRQQGYDATPTKLWLSRLARAGFEDVRRAWVCLPFGSSPAKPEAPVALRESPTGEEVQTVTMEAMVMGSTDQMANVCGLLGSWSWERWLLRAEMEKANCNLRLADIASSRPEALAEGRSLKNVHAMIEEGRKHGSAFRMLNGYARKPMAQEGMIKVLLG